MKKNIIVTNNPLVAKITYEDYEIKFVETDFLGVLKEVRDMVHQNHEILTHPLSSSLKPNETPYKSVILLNEKFNNMDFESLGVIESSIETTIKFLKIKTIKNWHPSALEDFQVVDLSLIENAIKLKTTV